jgi:ferredoxin-NADP reductase
MPVPPTFEARLVAARMLSPSVRELTFEREDGEPFVFQPGQWVNVFLPFDDLKRSYSIASAPSSAPRFDLAVTHVRGGPVSSRLHELELGTRLRFVGPQGFFTRAPDSPHPSLMIATGTGITPMRSMITSALAAASTAPMWLLFGVRHEHDILYRDELEAMARKHRNIRLEITLSQPGDAWSGRRGWVQAHVRELWDAMTAFGSGEPHAYVCGLERMIASVRELLRKQMAIARQQVHAERYD